MGSDYQRTVLLAVLHPRMLHGSRISALVCPPVEAPARSIPKQTVRRGDQVHKGRLCRLAECVLLSFRTRAVVLTCQT